MSCPICDDKGYIVIKGFSVVKSTKESECMYCPACENSLTTAEDVFNYVFSETGNIKADGFDPYRDGKDKHPTMYWLLFDEHDSVRYWFNIMGVRSFMHKNNISTSNLLNCDMVKILHWDHFSGNCKSNYPTIYGWR